MVIRRLGGGILAAVSIAVPVIFEKMDLHLTGTEGAALVAVCLLFAVVGVIMVFWPEPKQHTPAASEPARPLPPGSYVGEDGLLKPIVRPESTGTRGFYIGPGAGGSLYIDCGAEADIGVEDHGGGNTFIRFQHTASGKAQRDPDGIYQHGHKVGSVRDAKKRIDEGAVYFAQLITGPEANGAEPFQFQGLILKVVDYSGGGQTKSFGNVVATTITDVKCEIVGRA